MSYMDILSIVLPALAFVCVLLLLFVNIYSKLRPNKFVNVNCWFCNQWTKIPREFENSWDCPFCEQYNGFSSDGGYNKLIPAQHDELMNKLPLNVPIAANKILDNGFCSTCNNNQQLKIQQLAMFSPIDDNHYDEEIETYKEQLERAYKLCSQCDSVLKKTLQKKKSLLLGIRLKTLKQQGLDYLNIKKSYRIFSKTAIKKKISNTIRYGTIILASIRLYEIIKNCDYSYEKLNETLPSFSLPYILVTKDLIVLIHNLLSSIFVYIFYLHGIVVDNCLSAISVFLKSFNIFLNLPEYSFMNTYFFYKLLKQTKLQTFSGFALQFVWLTMTKKKARDSLKLTAWLILTYLSNLSELNMSTKLFEIVLYSLIIIVPSTRQQKIKMKTKKTSLGMKEKSDVLDEDLNLNISSSTEIPKSEVKLNDSNSFGSWNNSPPKPAKLLNESPKSNENLFHVFGSQPVFENPLNISYFKSKNHRVTSSSDSFSTNLNSSLNSSNYSDNLNLNDSFTSENTANKTLSDFELNKCLSDLHLSSFSNERRHHDNGELPRAFRVSSPLMRPKPVLSPPKLQNITQSSWAAGGYWKPNEFYNNFNGFTNLSRSSSQSSGFSSQASSQQPFHSDVFNSLPSSRTNSICGEFDKYSVFSEPAYPYNKTSSPIISSASRFYPELRTGEQFYICPKPMNIYVQKSVKPQENFAIPSPSRPSSRESMFTPTNLNLNTSFSNFSTCSSYRDRGSNIRPSSVNSNFYSEPAFTKGTLLQKWREQLPNTIQNL